jgi:hypothetical protein
MRGLLPEAVRLRPKTPLAGWPGAMMLGAAESQWLDGYEAAPGLGDYVVRERVPKTWGGDDPSTAWRNLRPLTLSFWLKNLCSR